MDATESRPHDWKTCFKKILAPHLLNPANMEEQNDAPYLRNASHGEVQNDAHFNIVNPKNNGGNTITFLKDIEKSEDVQKNAISSFSARAVHINDRSLSFIDAFYHSRDSISPDRKLNDNDNSVETDENIAQIIAADAEELTKNFKKLKFKKKHNNMAQNSRNPPEWKHAFKKVLDPACAAEDSLKTPEALKTLIPEELRNEAMKRIRVVQAGGPIDTEFYDMHPELLESAETSPWTYHILNRDYKPLGNKEELGDSDDKLTELQSNIRQVEKKEKKVKRKLSKQDKKALEILRLAQCFRAPKKAPMNIFDGAGVNCFKDSERESTKNISSSPEKPKNVPPPGGWVCVKPCTIEDARNRPINVIESECWDYYDDEW